MPPLMPPNLFHHVSMANFHATFQKPPPSSFWSSEPYAGTPGSHPDPTIA